MIKLSDIYPNPNNPRLIKDDKFKKLVNSIRDFPQMTELRPIVIDENNIIQGGNMRYKALLELGLIEISETWIKRGKDLTPEQWSEFVIKDNVSFGVMDWDIIANEWDAEQVTGWGLDLPGFDAGEGNDPFNDPGITAENKFAVVVTCESAIEQEEVFNDLQAKGYKCKVLVV